MISKYSSVGFTTRLEKIAPLRLLTREDGFVPSLQVYSIEVTPLSVQFVRDLLNQELGTNNYHLIYRHHKVTYKFIFHLKGNKEELPKLESWMESA